jgi:poly [ADP-ribose] polymerase
VFRLERPGEAESFAKFEEKNRAKIGDRRLLWHGSPTSNFSGILSQGLRSQHGIFFAEISTKSAGYCRALGEALMLLCEVELGKSSSLSTEHRGCDFYQTWCDAGDIHPDFKGTQVPDLDAKKTSMSSQLYHSEYVVHNPAQIRQRYLFHVVLGQGQCGL